MPVMAHLGLIEQQGHERGQVRRVLRLQTRGELADGETANVTVHNASTSGMLIETAAALSEGEDLILDLPQIGIIQARAVWRSGQLFGCQFETEVNSSALSALQLQSEPPLLDSFGGGIEGRSGQGESFGKKIEQLRKSRGLTLADVAKELGVSKPTVWAWEKGKARPIEDRIPALASVLRTDPNELTARTMNPGLVETIDDARQRVAIACGVNPEKVRIMVDL